MAVVLTVLTIIGKILLILLCAAVVLLLLVLFVPVRYETEGSLNFPKEEQKPELSAEQLAEKGNGNASFSWLFHLVRGGIAWPEQPEFEVWILWFRVFRKNRDRADDAASGDEVPKDKKAGINSGGRNDQQPASSSEDETEDIKGEGQSRRRPSLRLRDAYAKIRKGWHTVRRYAEFLTDPATRAAEEKAGKRLVRILSELQPRTWRISGTVGLGDPEKAGILLEILGYTWPLTGGHVSITPEFYLYQCELSGSASGQIRMISVAAAALALLADRNVRSTYKRFKRLRSDSGERHAAKTH